MGPGLLSPGGGGSQDLCPAGHHGCHQSFPGPKLDWVALSPHASTADQAGITKRAARAVGAGGTLGGRTCSAHLGGACHWGWRLPLSARSHRLGPVVGREQGGPRLLLDCAAAGRGGASPEGPCPPPRMAPEGTHLSALGGGVGQPAQVRGRGEHGSMAGAPLGAGAGLLSLKQNHI